MSFSKYIRWHILYQIYAKSLFQEFLRKISKWEISSWWFIFIRIFHSCIFPLKLLCLVILYLSKDKLAGKIYFSRQDLCTSLTSMTWQFHTHEGAKMDQHIKSGKCPKYSGSFPVDLQCQINYCVHTYFWYMLVQLSLLYMLWSYRAVFSIAICLKCDVILYNCSKFGEVLTLDTDDLQYLDEVMLLWL